MIHRLQALFSTLVLVLAALPASVLLLPLGMAQNLPTPPSRPVCGNSWCGAGPVTPPRYCPSCVQARQQEQSERNAANAERKRINHASDLNNKGVKEANKGNWAKALELYKQAYALNPSDLYRGNIQGASFWLLKQTAEHQLPAAQARIASLSTAIDQKVSAADSAASDRVVQFRNQAHLLDSSATIAPGGGTDLFSIRTRVAGPLPALAASPLPTAQTNSALEDLSSIAKSSKEAADLAQQSDSLQDANLDIAKALSNCGFDSAPCAEPEHLTYPHPVQTPAASALTAQIPEAARKAPEIQQRLREDDSLEMHRAEQEQRIAEVTRSIKEGGPNTDALKAYRTDLVKQADQDKQLQAQTTQFIHMRIQTISVAGTAASSK